MTATAELLLALALIGCSNKGKEATSQSAASGAGGGKSVDLATVGSVTGMVKLDGEPPSRKEIFMASVTACAKQHPSPALSEDVLVGDKGGLQNVVVYLQGDFSQYSFPRPANPAHMDQKGCMFVPHVIAVMSNAPVQFLSSDDTPHNIHPAPKQNREWNESQPKGGPPIERSFARAEVAIPIKCNLHHWMNGYIAVLDNPFFEVTGSDGSFDLSNVPPGTYRLIAWHEVYGTNEQTVTINPHQAQTVSVTYHAAVTQ